MIEAYRKAWREARRQHASSLIVMRNARQALLEAGQPDPESEPACERDVKLRKKLDP